MTVILSTQAQAEFLEELADNPTPQELDRIGGDHGMLYGEALNFASKHGFPRPQSLRRAASALRNPTSLPPQGGTAQTTGAKPGKDYVPPRMALDAPEPSKEQKMTTENVDLNNESTDYLLAVATDETSSKRVQAAAATIGKKVDALRVMVQEEWATREARAEVARLEGELAKAKAALKGGATPATPDSGDAKRIREWAKGAGIDCPTTGRIPAAVRAMYDASQDEAAS